MVACIMMSAVAYVATYESPHPYQSVVDRMLEQKLKEYLNLLDESAPTPGACTADDQLEQLLVEGLSGKRALWDGRERFWPPAVVRNLYIDNGRELYTLYEKWDFVGHGERRTIFPLFSQVEVVPESSTATGADPLIVQTPALQHSLLVKPRGEAVRAQVIIDGLSASIDHEAWVPTALLDSRDDPRHHGTNLSWRRDGSLAMVANIAPAALLPRATADEEVFFVNLSVPQGDLSPSTRLHVQLPAGWNVTRVTEASWDYAWLANDSIGPTLQFRPGAEQVHPEEIRISAFPPLNVTGRAFDIFHAYLTGGSFAQSSLVVVYPRDGDTNAGQLDLREGRVVLPTTPYPMSLGNASLFGVAFANGGEDTVVREVNIEVPGGYDHHRHKGAGSALFAQGVPEVVGGPSDGSWSWVSAKHLQWRGAREVLAGQATEWILSVNATSDASQTTSIEHAESKGFHSTLTFENGFVSTSALWGRIPGVIEHRVPPASDGVGAADGYPHLPNASTEPLTHTISARLVTSRGTLEDTGTYVAVPAAGEATSSETNLKDSYFQVSNRTAPLKSTVVARADFRSLIASVADEDATDVTLALDLYAPPTFGCAPTHSWSRAVTDLPRSPPTDVVMHDFVGGGLDDILVAHADSNVSRWDHTLTNSWTRSVGSAGTRVAAAPFLGAWGVVVGDEAGRVHWLDHATGGIAWTRNVSQSSEAGGAVTELVVDAANETMFAGTADGWLARYDANGVASAGVLLGGRIVSVASPTAAGDLWVDTEAALLRLDAATLAEEARYVSGSGLGLSVGDAGVLRASTHNITLHDVATLAPILVQRQEGYTFLVSAAGDATGDGVPDLVTVRSDLEVGAWNGATGELTWHVHPQWEAPGAAGTPWVTQSSGQGLNALEDVSCGEATADVIAYGDEATCAYVQEYRDAHPISLRVGSTGTALAFGWDGFTSVTRIDWAGAPAWTETFSKGTKPTVVAQGTRLGTPVVAVGTSEGAVALIHAESGTSRGSVTPSAAVGQFAFGLHVPGGGFFGTHILVATLSWNTVDGLPQEARLVDWFHVVDTDGTPVDLPAYDIVLIGYYQDEPLGARGQPN